MRTYHSESLEIVKDKQLSAFSDRRKRTFGVFTLKDHPAHPAWITRHVYEEGSEIRLRQIAYFAESETDACVAIPRVSGAESGAH